MDRSGGGLRKNRFEYTIVREEKARHMPWG